MRGLYSKPHVQRNQVKRKKLIQVTLTTKSEVESVQSCLISAEINVILPDITNLDESFPQTLISTEINLVSLKTQSRPKLLSFIIYNLDRD